MERIKGPTTLALPTMLPSSLELIAGPAPHPSHLLASLISSKAWAPASPSSLFLIQPPQGPQRCGQHSERQQKLISKHLGVTCGTDRGRGTDCHLLHPSILPVAPCHLLTMTG